MIILLLKYKINIMQKTRVIETLRLTWLPKFLHMNLG